jgi:hypothetical protein
MGGAVLGAIGTTEEQAITAGDTNTRRHLGTPDSPLASIAPDDKPCSHLGDWRGKTILSSSAPPAT